MAKGDYAGALEELIMLAVLKGGEDAYGLSIQRILRDAGRRLELPTIYTTLERLEDKGWIASQLGGATAVRGGRAKRIFRVAGAGMRVIRDSENARRQLGPLKPLVGRA
jgi:PadR family transcriptional regulator, regulatory protein PadR